jgi:hypothetical protein
MPYVDPKTREALDEGQPMAGPGDLNYLITKLLLRYWTNSNRRYQDINDIMGALSGAQAEFYRRVAVPYEEKKIRENGDVY